MEEGALPSQVDDVMEEFGMKLGIFKTMDLSGKLVPLWNSYIALVMTAAQCTHRNYYVCHAFLAFAFGMLSLTDVPVRFVMLSMSSPGIIEYSIWL